MNVYRQGDELTLILPVVDNAGSPICAVTASYRIIDSEDAPLVDFTDLDGFSEGDTEVTITVPASINTLAADVRRDLRLIELKFVTDMRTVYAEHRYVVERAANLVLMENSYQTINQAHLRALEMTGLIAWAGATDQARMAALIDAYHNIGKLNFEVPQFGQDSQFYRAGWQSVSALNDLTGDEFEVFSDAFKTAVRKAQIAEADLLLNGDPVGDLRRRGLMSKTVGESSEFFRPGKPMTLPVSEGALRYLTGYVSLAPRIVRG